jgi:putative peptidoglycan lipid II flippase
MRTTRRSPCRIFVNYLIAGGALSVTFIPVFTKYMAEDREQEGWHVFSTVIVFMTLLLAAAVLVGEVFASQLVGLIAPGFPSDQKAEVVFLTRLMLPAQFGFVFQCAACLPSLIHCSAVPRLL